MRVTKINGNQFYITKQLAEILQLLMPINGVQGQVEPFCEIEAK